MEPAQSSVIKVWLGEFPVVEVKDELSMTLNIGKNVHITVYLGSFAHDIKPGQTLPLFTEIPYANIRPPSVQ